jgi:hypothetical protein
MRGQGRVFRRNYRDKRTGAVKVSMTFTLEYYLDGTMCREASGTTSYTEAVRQLKRRQGEIAQGRRVAPAADRLTFEHLAANLVDDYRAHGRRSLERVEDALTHLRRMLSGYRARTIDGALVTKYIVDRQTAGAANATVNRELAALKRMYRLADEQLGGYHPTIRMLKEDNVRRGFFERPQFRRRARPAARGSQTRDAHGLYRGVAAQVRGLHAAKASCRPRSRLAAPRAGRDEGRAGAYVPAGPGTARRARAPTRRNARLRAADRVRGAVALPPRGPPGPGLPPPLVAGLSAGGRAPPSP